MDSENDNAGYHLSVRSTMEFDGGIGFDVKLRSLRDSRVSDVALEIPYLELSCRTRWAWG
jgi:hypothetical protein